MQHIILYKWSTEKCFRAKHVLKTDDDVFVDTFHLPNFLKQYEFTQQANFLLCLLLQGNKPLRNVDSKWHVTKEEYNEEEYPPYCDGPVYVTTLETMRKIIEKVEMLNYLFIDDVLVTGIGASGITFHFDWSNRILEGHTGHRDPLLNSETYYTPLLLAAINIDSRNIYTLFKKSKKCFYSNCYGMLSKIPTAVLKPPKVTETFSNSSEL